MSTPFSDSTPATQYTLFGPRGTPYPGHPLVLAYFITEHFESLEQALAVPKGVQTRNLFNRPGVPGSLGSLAVAVDVLKMAQTGRLEDAARLADEAWRKMAYNSFKPAEWEQGQAHAALVRERLGERLNSWSAIPAEVS